MAEVPGSMIMHWDTILLLDFLMSQQPHRHSLNHDKSKTGSWLVRTNSAQVGFKSKY